MMNSNFCWTPIKLFQAPSTFHQLKLTHFSNSIFLLVQFRPFNSDLPTFLVNTKTILFTCHLKNHHLCVPVHSSHLVSFVYHLKLLPPLTHVLRHTAAVSLPSPTHLPHLFILCPSEESILFVFIILQTAQYCFYILYHNLPLQLNQKLLRPRSTNDHVSLLNRVSLEY